MRPELSELESLVGFVKGADVVFVPFARVPGSERIDWARFAQFMSGWHGGMTCQKLATLDVNDFKLGVVPRKSVSEFRNEYGEAWMSVGNHILDAFLDLVEQAEDLEIVGDPLAENIASVGVALLLDARVRHYARRGLSGCSCR